MYLPLPVVFVVTQRIAGFQDDHEGLEALLLLNLLERKHAGLLTQNCQLRTRAIDVFVFYNACVNITHHIDEHANHSGLCEEDGEEEED